MNQAPVNTAPVGIVTYQSPVTQNATVTTPRNTNSIIFAAVLIAYEILALPIFGVLFSYSTSFSGLRDYGGILLISITTIFLIVGMGLINTYVVRSSFTGMTFTLVIFALTIQHFFLFRAFWNKAGTNDYDSSTKDWSTIYSSVTLTNIGNDRQTTTLLPSGPFVEGVTTAISMAVAYNSVVGRIGLLEVFLLTLFGSFFYEINSQLLYRWFVTDVGFGFRIILFGSTLGAVIAFLLGRRQTTKMHGSYRSQYRIMAFALLGFLFMFVGLPFLTTITIFTQSYYDNVVLFATNLNAWLAVFSGVLGTFTANSLFYRKFALHDVVFVGLSGAYALGMEPDITFNPCVPLIVGFITGFISSISSMTINRKINNNGVLFTLPHLNRFFIPAIIGAIVSGIVQACSNSQNGSYPLNRLSARTAIQQGGWQILGILITIGIALLGGLIIGILVKIINKNNPEDQFNDELIYYNVPSAEIQTD